MSKTAKMVLVFLVVLFVGVAGFALMTMMEKQKLQEQAKRLQNDLDQAQTRETANLKENKKLKDESKVLQNENEMLEDKVKAAERQAEDLSNELADLKAERDEIKSSVDKVAKERDQLTQTVNALNTQIAQLKIDKEELERNASAQGVTAVAMPMEEAVDDTVPVGDDQYWAQVLKEKAALQVRIDQLQGELNKKAMEIVELKQGNIDLQTKLEDFIQTKDSVDQDIKYKTDMINTLSLELARSKNDKKFVSDRMAKMESENESLREQLKALSDTRSNLEKTILRLTEDKTRVEKELGQQESLIQAKIDELWELKEGIDREFKSSQRAQASKEVELPPIVVSSAQASMHVAENTAVAGFDGKVVSLNEDNNFAIVNLGEGSGLRLGDVLNVYRDNKNIARIEVIQVRKDIAAADIKDQSMKIRVGDIVR